VDYFADCFLSPFKLDVLLLETEAKMSVAMTSASSRIAKSAKTGSRDLASLTIVTLVFLPATFLAALLPNPFSRAFDSKILASLSALLGIGIAFLIMLTPLCWAVKFRQRNIWRHSEEGRKVVNFTTGARPMSRAIDVHGSII